MNIRDLDEQTRHYIRLYMEAGGELKDCEGKTMEEILHMAIEKSKEYAKQHNYLKTWKTKH